MRKFIFPLRPYSFNYTLRVIKIILDFTDLELRYFNPMLNLKKPKTYKGPNEANFVREFSYIQSSF
jgi:hypothetical protein